MVTPESKRKFRSIARELGVVAASSPQNAKRMVKAVLHLWQKKQFAHLAAKTPYGTTLLLKNVCVQRFTEWLIAQPFNDAAFWLATAYATWVGDEVRSKQALYFTPPKLADRVIDDLVARGASLINNHWYDPACGGAAFLVPVAKRMAVELEQTGLTSIAILKKIEKQISGTDLNETLLDLSAQFLLMALSKHIDASGFTPTFLLNKGDGLLIEEEGKLKANVVVCNPPYRKLNTIETKKYAAGFWEVIRNQPNIYGLFIHKTISMVRPGGLVGLLTPTSFLSGTSFSKLRSCIVKNSDVLQIDMLSGRASTFISVTQEAVITILQSKLEFERRDTATTLVRERLTEIYALNAQGAYHLVGSSRLLGNGVLWPIPRSLSDAALMRGALQWTSRLCDYGYSPKIGHLVPYRDERKRFPKRPKRKDQSRVVPIVWAGDITVAGFEHGRTHNLDRVDYFVEVSNPTHPSVIRAPSVVLQRLTSNDQAHRLIACAVPHEWQTEEGGFVAENHVIALVANDDTTWKPQVIADLMNSDLVNRLYRAISGATNVAVGEINELPLPNPVELKAAMAHGEAIDVAIQIAFGLRELDKKRGRT